MYPFYILECIFDLYDLYELEHIGWNHKNNWNFHVLLTFW